MSKYPTGIDHVIVLALENRSFDHMLGYYRKGQPGFLQGEEVNHEDPAVPASPVVQVSNTAAYTGDLNVDPSHEVTHVTVQLFGADVAQLPPPDAPHGVGFVLDYGQQPGAPVAANIMKCFDPAKLPVLAGLADAFTLCTNWFSSVPGQTWPNRFFMHCATAGGCATNDALRIHDMRTIYQNLTDAGLDWAIYFHDFPQALTLAQLQDSAFRGNFRFFPDFFRDLKNKTLPHYVFLEPRYFDFLQWKANDQHPPHDVSLGEHLIADVYEQLRASDYWATSLFVILYDEHGGIYDHVRPPEQVPNPDGKVSTDPPFDFTRLGLRVPAVLVSPFVPKGAIDETVYDHTSLLATVKDIFKLPAFLTERDRWANTFTNRFLKGPRPDADAPRTLTRPGGDPQAAAFHDEPGAATMTASRVLAAKGETAAVSRAALSEFQQSLVDFTNGLDTGDSPRLRVLQLARRIDDEYDAAVHLRDTAARFLGNG
ncbi:MAG: alkaline phosphatase family protein [Acidobacteriota bacterium]|nr:alkaline phosphatase family protein [Acidobacteriota bacterium]